MRFKDYMAEEKVHMPTVVSQSNAKPFLDELRSLGVKVINIYDLLKNAGKYQDAFVLGLTGEANLYSILAKALNFNTWTDSYRKLKLPASETEKLIRGVSKTNKLIYLMPPSIYVSTDNDMKYNRQETGSDARDEYLARANTASITEREFWAILYLCQTNQANIGNIVVVLGAHHIIWHDDRNYVRDPAFRPNAIDQLKNWKANVNRSPMNKDYKGIV